MLRDPTEALEVDARPLFSKDLKARNVYSSELVLSLVESPRLGMVEVVTTKRFCLAKTNTNIA
jgi:hypothetical protein